MIARSAQPTHCVPQSAITARTRPANGSTTPARLDSLWARDIDAAVCCPGGRASCRIAAVICRIVTMPGPFEAIPVSAADALRPALGPVADEIIQTIAQEVPDYERAMDGVFGKVVRHGVEVALGRF